MTRPKRGRVGRGFAGRRRVLAWMLRRLKDASNHLYVVFVVCRVGALLYWQSHLGVFIPVLNCSDCESAIRPRPSACSISVPRGVAGSAAAVSFCECAGTQAAMLPSCDRQLAHCPRLITLPLLAIE